MGLFGKKVISFGSLASSGYIVVGLGNPGPKYRKTRHNAGFLALEVLAQMSGIKADRLRFKSLIGETAIGGVKVVLMRPQTFMNLSGLAVKQAMDFYKLPPERLLVIFDDASLELGRLRIRAKGSDGGHNGVRSIIEHLGTDEFPRIKIGIGQKPDPQMDLADWVLGQFTEQEQKTIFESLKKAAMAVEEIVVNGIPYAMSKYNS